MPKPRFPVPRGCGSPFGMDGVRGFQPENRVHRVAGLQNPVQEQLSLGVPRRNPGRHGQIRVNRPPADPAGGSLSITVREMVMQQL